MGFSVPAKHRHASSRRSAARWLGSALLRSVRFALGLSLTFCVAGRALAAGDSRPAEIAASAAADAPAPRFDVMEYRVDGNSVLPQDKIEEAVYPFLGEQKTADDVEHARASLEKAYQGAGYLTVVVELPEQRVTTGVVTFAVTEGKIGRLRITGSKYTSLDRIREDAPALAEGAVPYFPKVQENIATLNQVPDRRVTPELKAGRRPGTVDVDLHVEDKLPLHGSLELNNRSSPATTDLRLDGALRYDNLFQLGHSLSATFEIAPQNPDDSVAVSGSYLFPIHGTRESILIYGVHTDSNAASLGGATIIGSGGIIGVRGIIPLGTATERYYQSLTLGLDYKDLGQDTGLLTAPTVRSRAPVHYWPMLIEYTGQEQDSEGQTAIDGALNFLVRGLGNDSNDASVNINLNGSNVVRPGSAFDIRRSGARPDYLYFRGNVSRTESLPYDANAFARVDFQLADQPLIDSEEFPGGGFDYVRGFHEAEELGDDAVRATFELRSPSVVGAISEAVDLAELKEQIAEWRFLVFFDSEYLWVKEPLPDEPSAFKLSSVGIGTRLKAFDHLNASFDLAWALTTAAPTAEGDVRALFRVWSEF